MPQTKASGPGGLARSSQNQVLQLWCQSAEQIEPKFSPKPFVWPLFLMGVSHSSSEEHSNNPISNAEGDKDGYRVWAIRMLGFERANLESNCSDFGEKKVGSIVSPPGSITYFIPGRIPPKHRNRRHSTPQRYRHMPRPGCWYDATLRMYPHRRHEA